VTVNGKPAGSLQASGKWLEGDLDGQLRSGENVVKVRRRENATGEITWTDLMIEVQNGSNSR
jgi:hypothetical protein